MAFLSQLGTSYWGVFVIGGSLMVNGVETLGKGGESVSQVPQCALLKLGFFHTIGLYPRRIFFFLFPWLFVPFFCIGGGLAVWWGPAQPPATYKPSDLFTSESFLSSCRWGRGSGRGVDSKTYRSRL